MTDEELLSILKQEEADASSFHQSDLAKDQSDAMDRYYARPYGDEVPGRSKVCTHDIEDTINWLMPHLMRTFMSSDELITIEGASRDDELPDPNCKVYPKPRQPMPGEPEPLPEMTQMPQQEAAPKLCDQPRTKIAAQYCNHILFRDNCGETVIHDFAFDGLLQRQGVVEIAWEDPEPSPPKMLEGLSEEQVTKYALDDEYEIVEQEEDEGRWSLKVIHKPRMGRVRVWGVPPEEFRISRRAKSIEEADYHARKRDVFLADIMRMYPDKARDLDPTLWASKPSSEDEGSETDERRQARFGDESAGIARGSYSHARRRKASLIEEYIRVDFDEDDVVELRHVKRIGDVILENMGVDKSKYVDWTPIRVAHKVHGRSIADVLGDIQRIRTVVTRRALDALAQSLTPRKLVNTNAVDADGIDDLLDNDIGGIVRVKGDPAAAVMDLVTPDVSGSAYQTLEYWDQRSEEASGVTRHSQGLNPQAITETMGGIDMLQAAAMSRVELIARWLGFGVENIVKRILELVCAHQDQARQIKMGGEWFEIDPRGWSDEMSVSVHVGRAGVSRNTEIAHLSGIAAKQEQVLATAGMGNPMVTLSHLRNTYARMTQSMGFKDVSQFFGEVPDDWQPPQQQDPAMAEVQGKLQLQQAEAQQKAQIEQGKVAASMQLEQAKAQQQAQLSQAELEHKARMAQQDAATQTQIAALKAQNEKEIAQLRIQAETEVAAMRMEAEMALARWKAAQEMQLARERMEMSADNDAGGDGLNGSGDVRFGGKVG